MAGGKKSLRYRIYQQKPPKPKSKEQRLKRKKIQGLWDNYKRGNMHVMRIQGEKNGRNIGDDNDRILPS